jgi:Mg2+ and Co2+ transporter CorA
LAQSPDFDAAQRAFCYARVSGYASGMEITAYVVDEGRISPLRVTAQREIPARAIWVDVSGATREETISLAEQLGLQLELDAADLGFDVYGHVEVEGDQLTIAMQVDRAEAMDGLSDS